MIGVNSVPRDAEGSSARMPEAGARDPERRRERSRPEGRVVVQEEVQLVQGATFA